MPAQVIAVRAARVRAVGHSSAAHQVTGWAAQLCSKHVLRPLSAELQPCGWCAETAVRDVERRRLDPGYIATTDNVPLTRRPWHLGAKHPLARVAAQFCGEHSGRPVRPGRACSECWSRAFRVDEQVVVEHGLDRHLVVDHDLIDEVAVRLACSGERVELTAAERAVAVEQLLAEGLEPADIGLRLGMIPPAVMLAVRKVEARLAVAA